MWKGLHLMKRFSCAVKCKVKPLDLCYLKNLIFTQRICAASTGREQLENWDLMPATQIFGGMQLALDSPCCEKHSLWFSTGEVTIPGSGTPVGLSSGDTKSFAGFVICPGVGWLGWGQDAAASPQRALLLGRLWLSHTNVQHLINHLHYGHILTQPGAGHCAEPASLCFSWNCQPVPPGHTSFLIWVTKLGKNWFASCSSIRLGMSGNP